MRSVGNISGVSLYSRSLDVCESHHMQYPITIDKFINEALCPQYKKQLKHDIDTLMIEIITVVQDANTLIKFVAEEPERNKEFLHVIGKRDCYACLNSLPATSVCETCKKGLIHSHMVHVWGEDGEEVTVYYFKCDNCGDISTREEENGRR